MAAVDLDPTARLCPCGARGCDLAGVHAAAFVEPEPAWRKLRQARRRHKRKR